MERYLQREAIIRKLKSKLIKESGEKDTVHLSARLGAWIEEKL